MKTFLVAFFIYLSTTAFSQAPIVSSFTPTGGDSGTIVTIIGANFTGATQVSFGSTPAVSFVVDSATGITAVVNWGSAGFVKVTTPLGSDSLYGFNVPTIRSFNPTTGDAETYVTILGTNFYTATAVSFGGSPASSFSIMSDTVIGAIVGKSSSGLVAVTNPYGTATRSGFLYVGPPTITSFTPDSGAVNSGVVITGTGFNHLSTLSNNVYFSAIRGTVTAVTPTTLTVNVPAGAGYNPLTVTANFNTAYANAPYYITFPNNGLPLNNSSFAKHNFPILYDPFVVADFNGDNKPDIVVPHSFYGVFAYKNTSTGTTLNFINQTASATGIDATGIAYGNFDGDAYQDIAVSTTSNTVRVYKNFSNTSTISFINNGITLFTGNSPQSPVVTDFNGDGKPDIALVNYNSNTVSVFKSTCFNCYYPSFGARLDLVSGTNPYKVSAADIDGDKLADLIVTNEGSATVSVYRNTSTFSSINFAPRTDLPALSSPRSIAITDLDKDGKPDIVVSSYQNISVYKNTSTIGIISFSSRTDYPAGLAVRGISAGDIDGDAKPDIIVTKGYDTLSILKNNSTPGNIVLAVKKDYTEPNINSTLSFVCDMNGDGKSDIIGGGYIFRNKIDVAPSITAFSPAIVLPADTIRISGMNLTGTTSVTIGGYAAAFFSVISDSVILTAPDQAGSGSIVVTTPYGSFSLPGVTVVKVPVINSFNPSSGPAGTVVTIRGTGFSTVSSENIVYVGGIKALVNSSTDSTLLVVVPPGAGFIPISVTIPDRKLTANATLPFIVTFPGAGNSFTSSSFASKLNFSCDTLGKVFINGDIDQNGKMDLIIAKSYSNNPNDNYFSNHLNQSTPGTFSFAPRIDQPVYRAITAMRFGDLNADGKQDVITANWADLNILSAYYNNFNNSSSLYAPVFHIDRNTISGETVWCTDLDMDGRNDLIQRAGNFFLTRFIRNTSNSQGNSFGPITTSGDQSNVWAMSDFDGDGKMDYIGSILMRVYRNISTPGNILFGAQVPLQLISNPVNSMDLADFDRDGKPDIIFMNFNNSKYSIIRNTSTPGNISAATQIDSTFINPGVFSLGDMDGDGKIDIVIAKSGTDSVAVIKNLSTGPGQISFADKVYYKTGGRAVAIVLSDMDADGRLDIVTLNDKNGCCGSAKTFSILRNRIGEPQLVTLCPNGNISFSSDISGTTYQWQLDTGAGYANISNNASYAGTNSATLQINNTPSNWYGYKYRCLVDATTSYEYSLVFANNWTGSVNNAWENPANWACGSVPDANTDVVINSGSVQVNANTAIRSLIINPGASVTVAPGVTFTVLH